MHAEMFFSKINEIVCVVVVCGTCGSWGTCGTTGTGVKLIHKHIFSKIFQQYFLEHWEHAARQEQVPAHEAHRVQQEHLQRSLGNIRRQTDLL